MASFDPYYAQIDPNLYAQQAVFPPAPVMIPTVTVKHETPNPETPIQFPNPSLPVDSSATPLVGNTGVIQEQAESSKTGAGEPTALAKPPKKKVPRAGHGVGAGGGNAVSTYKNKPLMWVPPPTYPYNLIPGRDLTADVIPPRPSETSNGFLYPPIDESVMIMATPAQPPVKKKKKPKKPTDEEDEDGSVMEETPTLTPEEEAERAAALERRKEKARLKAEAAALKPPSSTLTTKKPGYREKTEKAKLLEQEKEEKEREKAERAAARAEKAGGTTSKAKTSEKDKENKSKSSTTKTGAKGKAVAFAANQGERVAGARNAIHEEFEEEDDVEEEIEIDTRLYCICKQMYDDDRIMIACDNCDDWCHPGCVGLVEEDLELVDLFYCPACLAAHPNLSVTYKTACALETCRHPARLPLSKFCSDECGITCVMKRVDDWCLTVDPPPVVPPPKLRPKAKSATPREHSATPAPLPPLLQKLEASRAVRFAKRREGLVSVESDPQDTTLLDAQAARRKVEEERAMAKHRTRLAQLKIQRAHRIRMQAIVGARLSFLDIVVQRAQWLDSVRGSTGVCGYDSRLAMDEDDWVDWVDGEEASRAFEGYGIGDDFPDTDDARLESDAVAQSVCRQRRKCERHSGWQKLKTADFELEKRGVDSSLQKLVQLECDIRQRIADIQSLQTPPELPPPPVVKKEQQPKEEDAPQVDVIVPDSPLQTDGPSIVAAAGSPHLDL